MAQTDFLGDVALLTIGAVFGLVPWLMDKVGIEMSKPVYVGLLLLSFGLVGWALHRLGWVEYIPMLRGKQISLSSSVICGIVLLLASWLLITLRGVPEFSNHDVKKWISDRNEVISNKRFFNETVEIDNRTFDHCTFENVQLMYHGLGAVTLVEPKWVGTNYVRTDNVAAGAYAALQLYFSNIPNMQGIFSGRVDSQGNFTKQVPPEVKKAP
jgi:hypothetical protein